MKFGNSFGVQDLRRLFPEERDLVKVSLVEAREILSSFDERLRSYTERLIHKRGSMEIIKSSVTEVTPTHVTLNDGTVLPCGMVVWSTGVAPR